MQFQGHIGSADPRANRRRTFPALADVHKLTGGGGEPADRSLVFVGEDLVVENYSIVGDLLGQSLAGLVDSPVVLLVLLLGDRRDKLEEVACRIVVERDATLRLPKEIRSPCVL